MARFEEVFSDETKRGRKIQTCEYLPTGKYPIIDQGQAQIAGYTNLEEGLFKDVPAIIFGDHTRVIKYVDFPFFLGADGVKVLKAKIDDVSYKYLFYSLQNARIPNTGYNRHYKWLKEVDIPLPELEEQRRIAALLDKVSDLIAKRRAQLDKLDLLVKARFVEMFGDITANPKGWKKEKLQSHIDMITGFPFNSSGYSENGVKICGGLIIMPDQIKWDECKFWPDSLGYEQFLLQEDDIVVALDRPWISEGFKIGEIRAEDLPALLIQRTARIRGRDITQQFLLYLLKDKAFERHCTITGSLVPHISNKDINSYEVILPPHELQQQFEEFFHKIKILKLTAQQSVDKLEVLKKALMQQYFG